MAYQELTEEEVRQEYYSKLNHLSQMDQPPPRIKKQPVFIQAVSCSVCYVAFRLTLHANN